MSVQHHATMIAPSSSTPRSARVNTIMLTLNPPLGALHGARLDHSSAVALGIIDAVEHLYAASLRLHSRLLERVAEHTRADRLHATPMIAVDVATDPEISRMGTDLFKEHLQLQVNLGSRLIALGEWHQHSFNAIVENWLAHCKDQFRGMPAVAGVEVMMEAVESVDRSVSEAAIVAVDATEAVARQAESIESAVAPKRKATKK